MRERHKVIADFGLLIFILAVTLGAFTGSMWGLLGIGGGVILYGSVALIDKKFPALPKTFVFLALLALGILAAELPLSSHIGVSTKKWAHLASVFLPLLLLLAPRVQAVVATPVFLKAVAAAMALGVMALGLELLTGGVFLHALTSAGASLTAYNRSMAHLVILAFPIIGGLWVYERKSLALGLGFLLLFPALQTASQTAGMALAVGALCTLTAFVFPRLARGSVAGVVLLSAGWPFYAQKLFVHAAALIAKLPGSWAHRVEIWDFLSYRIAERPVFGWGLGTTNELDFSQPHGELYHYVVKAAPHAHNFIVQLWVETGATGLALGLAFVLLTLRSVSSMSAALRPFALGCIAVCFVTSMFGFDFWTDALWAAFALAAFVFGVLQKDGEGKKHFIHA